MKNIKKYIVLVLLCLPLKQFAQVDVRDKTLVQRRTAMATAIGAIVVERGLLSNRLDALTKEEIEFQKKLRPVANLTSTPIYLQMERKGVAVEDLIKDLEDEIRRIERIPRALRHGIWLIKQKLADEKRYYEEADRNIAMALAEAIAAGGVGYNYTYWLKQYLQMRRIESRLQQLQYELDNSGTLNRIFKGQ